MPATLKEFQETLCAGIVARFNQVRRLYEQLAGAPPEQWTQARCNDAVTVLCAPTGAGKTLIAVETMRRVSATGERVLWFWFAPFSGLVEQSRQVIAAQAPELDVFDLQSDRCWETVRSGGVFVVTWAAVAVRNTEGRRARTHGDSGMSLDVLLALAREEGVRIGCVVDEAHHTALSGHQARLFFQSVLAPDYALLMTATPRDADVMAFERATGYMVGQAAEWAMVSRFDAVQAGLLKYGVRMVRFIAQDGDAAQLIDFEHLALRQCAETHRMIKCLLADAGVALTPLMLVQVPDGRAAQDEARRFLTEQLHFDHEAVRIHTADEPDPALLSLANDPTVEVLIFKMAVALGFDAPRAFTLAALRGARDPAFGIQVIGRIVRKHALLQGRVTLPESLDYGYVFLSNAQSQEGLLDAGQQINTLTTQSPELGTQTVVTVIGEHSHVQVVRSGEPLSLLVSPQGVALDAVERTSQMAPDALGDPLIEEGWEPWTRAAQGILEWVGVQPGHPRKDAAASTTSTVNALLCMGQGVLKYYRRREDAPAMLRSERLPDPPADFEAQLMDFIDFNDTVLASRFRVRERVMRVESALFSGVQHSEEERQTDLWATLAPVAVAEKAEQIRLRLSEANDRELQLRLLEKFRQAIEQSGSEPPEDEELLLQQLELVLIRHPGLLRVAYRRFRHAQVVDVAVPLPAELHSDMPLQRAQRGLYGVFPQGLNQDETAVAQQLDASPLVHWWHRNPVRRPESVALYRWDDGEGFYPDFVVAMTQRNTHGQIALLEVKGAHLWGEPREVEKAAAVHPEYGRVFIVGRQRGERVFHHLRVLEHRLETDGVFTLDRLRHV
ncbi:DEAD/DEAH box helicase [Xylella fastidiosa]|uniref:DEAD/DEAH box helicase family protein n=1 Tax=Xylella fastidiosa subsp. fastidiosa TaxID=644356 RepID=A0AAJ5UIT5_XYLFS|nr:DEAD/DEAH box helicase family protein [Xylella fastidiosa]WCF29168.1 DEAD/DEAH box helicase family protein [Xylella fastidiosa subsp. fastidiosa]